MTLTPPQVVARNAWHRWRWRIHKGHRRRSHTRRLGRGNARRPCTNLTDAGTRAPLRATYRLGTRGGHGRMSASRTAADAACVAACRRGAVTRLRARRADRTRGRRRRRGLLHLEAAHPWGGAATNRARTAGSVGDHSFAALVNTAYPRVRSYHVRTQNHVHFAA